jgi:hypothetical protein
MNAFEQLPDDARIWIYAADRLLTTEEETQIKQQAEYFLSGWTAHEMPVDATFDILHHCFLVVGVNEQTSDISGCGIDKSFAFMKSLGGSLGIGFFDRMQIELLMNGRIGIFHKSDMKAMLGSGMVTPSTLTFNKMISRKGDMNQFEIPVSEAWFYKAIQSLPVGE